ncbi:(deoxy)nucleoside triphosphate pyrophosphohydrolase [Sphingomonas endolithica]|uniref:(deoxy)nucleoside triphosphate pyrophosphohydrolase n=1 Tax=Sphingomonas endolithica TaxID=2972485 RepID=UPI0021AFF3DE|nr:(deoxy)nucleoside triphosphate pyrophosphohydrolase [Sphingomonas sp. ZFBP2030]
MSKAPTHLFPVVAAALIDNERRVLVQQRPPGRQLAGLWEFPGGKIEPGETPEAALSRELMEELGIVVAPQDLMPLTFASAAHGEGHLLLLLYACRKWSGEPVALDAVALRWTSAAALRTLPMPPADAPFIPVIEALM